MCLNIIWNIISIYMRLFWSGPIISSMQGISISINTHWQLPCDSQSQRVAQAREGELLTLIQLIYLRGGTEAQAFLTLVPPFYPLCQPASHILNMGFCFPFKKDESPSGPCLLFVTITFPFFEKASHSVSMLNVLLLPCYPLGLGVYSPSTCTTCSLRVFFSVITSRL